MESEWTENENMDLNTHEEVPDPWTTPRRYHRQKGLDGSTLNSIKRAHKVPERRPHSTFHLMSKMGNMIYYAI